MAFKPVSMADCATFVSTYDSAVDKVRVCEREIDKHPDWREKGLSTEQMNELAWVTFQADFAAATARDPASSERMLLFKDGDTPTRFSVGAMSTEVFNRIVDETQETQTWRGKFSERMWRMFLHGLRGIENWPGKVDTIKIGDIEYVDPEWLRRNFIRGLRDTAIQVGAVVLNYNRLTEEEIKN